MDWNPSLYLKFHSERTQPSIDLVNRINLRSPENIIDLGCGPGNSTNILAERWPNARLTGLDNSAKMLEKAKADFPAIQWILADAGDYLPSEKYELVFSSAALQWISNHAELIPRIFSWLRVGGVLAVQVPANRDSELHLAMLRVSKKNKWKELTKGCEDLIFYHDADFYYKVLSPLTEKLAIWETTYFHILDSHKALIEWYRSTGMKTYLDRLPDDAARLDFESEVADEVIKNYPLQPDNKVIYPFKRLFFVASRKQ